jgi:Holliday junction resolvase RusA-like endonuclease
MEFTLKFSIEPFSINNARFRNGTFNQKARAYRSRFLKQLGTTHNQKIVAQLNKDFNPKKHFLTVSFAWLLPEDILFTKDKRVSHRSKDLDNCLKMPIDFLTKKKYKDLGHGTLDIDDKCICSLSTSKRMSPSGEYLLFISITLNPIQDLY